jgi:hypothetical protein
MKLMRLVTSGDFITFNWFERCRWVENIKIDLRELGRDSMDWIDLAQDRDQWRALVKMVVNLWVP